MCECDGRDGNNYFVALFLPTKSGNFIEKDLTSYYLTLSLPRYECEFSLMTSMHFC